MAKRLIRVVILLTFAMLMTSCALLPMDRILPERKNVPNTRDNIDLADRSAGSLRTSLDNEIDFAIGEVTLYFLSESGTTLTQEKKAVRLPTNGLPFAEIINALAQGPASPDLLPVIPRNTRLLNATQVENTLTVDLSSEFLRTEDLLISRAALVNTLVSIEGIDFIKIYVRGRELTQDGTLTGPLLGVLNEFPNNVSEIIEKEIETATDEDISILDWELYFQDKTGEFLISEVRTLTVRNKEFARAIVEELIKGPSNEGTGFYRTIPQGARLIDISIEKAASTSNRDRINLYLSNDFIKSFDPVTFDFQLAVGSLVYSLTSLSNVESVSVFYERESGGMMPIDLFNDGDVSYARSDFKDLLGRRIIIYFSDGNLMQLVPEYRAIKRDDTGIARQVISKIIEGPVYEGNIAVFSNLSIEDIRINVDAGTAFVDFPSTAGTESMGEAGEIMALYAIVNSLTDILNTRNIERVQFLVEGAIVDSIGSISVREPFIRNPALINDK